MINLTKLASISLLAISLTNNLYAAEADFLKTYAPVLSPMSIPDYSDLQSDLQITSVQEKDSTLRAVDEFDEYKENIDPSSRYICLLEAYPKTEGESRSLEVYERRKLFFPSLDISDLLFSPDQVETTCTTRILDETHIEILHEKIVRKCVSESDLIPDVEARTAFLERILAEFDGKLEFSYTRKWNHGFPGCSKYTLATSLPSDISDQYTFGPSGTSTSMIYTLMFPDSKSTLQTRLDSHSAGLFAKIDSIISEIEKELTGMGRKYELNKPYTELSLDHKTRVTQSDYEFAQEVFKQFQSETFKRLASIVELREDDTPGNISIAACEHFESLPKDCVETVAITPIEAFNMFGEHMLSYVIPVKNDE